MRERMRRAVLFCAVLLVVLLPLQVLAGSVGFGLPEGSASSTAGEERETQDASQNLDAPEQPSAPETTEEPVSKAEATSEFGDEVARDFSQESFPFGQVRDATKKESEDDLPLIPSAGLVLQVDTAADIPEAGKLTLRQAIEQLNADGSDTGGNTISFAKALGASGEITLLTPLPDILKPVEIRSLAAGLRINSPRDGGRHFTIGDFAGEVTLSGLRLVGAKALLVKERMDDTQQIQDAALSQNSYGGVEVKGTDARLVLQKCIVSHNILVKYEGIAQGGALYSAGVVQLEDCDFLYNRAFGFGADAAGGGVFCGKLEASGETRFLLNRAGGETAQGGGVFMQEGTVCATFEGNEVAGMGAAFGGALYAAGEVKITNSIATVSAAKGLRAQGGALFLAASAKIVDSVIQWGEASAIASSAQGGGIYAADALLLEGVILRNNTARVFAGTQNEVAQGGAVYAAVGAVLRESVLESNKAECAAEAGQAILAQAMGGGIYAAGGQVDVVNTTLWGNGVVGGFLAAGGAVCATDSALRMQFTTLSSNTVESLVRAVGGGVWADVSAAGSLLRGNIIAGNYRQQSSAPWQAEEVRNSTSGAVWFDGASSGALSAGFNLIGCTAGGWVNGILDPDTNENQLSVGALKPGTRTGREALSGVEPGVDVQGCVPYAQPWSEDAAGTILLSADQRGRARGNPTTPGALHWNAAPKPVVEQQLKLSEESLVLYVDEVYMLSAFFFPGNMRENAAVWSSGNSAVGEVSQQGVVTAKAPGSTVITAAASGMQDSCVLIVERAPVVATGLALNETQVRLEAKREVQLQATLLPAEAQPEPLVWHSSHPRTASVDANGLVRAGEEGSALITVEIKQAPYRAAVCKVDVISPVTKLQLGQSSVALVKGKSISVPVKIYAKGGVSAMLWWESSNSGVVSVSDTGRITAKKAGKAKITVFAANKTKALLHVQVLNKAVMPTQLRVRGYTGVLEDGAEEQLTAAWKPANATGMQAKWSSSNPRIVAVDEFGRVRANKKGRAVIQLHMGGRLYKKPYSVVAPVTAVKPAQKSVTLVLGNSVVLSAMGYTKDGSRAALQWGSSNEKVAVVSKAGKITAKNIGAAAVTIAAGKGKKAVVQVRVVARAKAVASVRVRGAPKSMKVGESKMLTAQITPVDATGVGMVWRSGKPGILAVDAAGKLVAKRPGLASITLQVAGKTKRMYIRVKR